MLTLFTCGRGNGSASLGQCESKQSRRTMSVEPLEMLCAKHEAADTLAPHAVDFKPEDLLYPLHLMCVFKKFILNPVLPFCYFFWSLTRLGLCELAVTSPLGFEPSLAHFYRQLATLVTGSLPLFLCLFFLSLASISSLLHFISAAVSLNPNSVGVSVKTYIFLTLSPFLGHIFYVKAFVTKTKILITS